MSTSNDTLQHDLAYLHALLPRDHVPLEGGAEPAPAQDGIARVETEGEEGTNAAKTIPAHGDTSAALSSLLYSDTTPYGALTADPAPHAPSGPDALPGGSTTSSDPVTSTPSHPHAFPNADADAGAPASAARKRRATSRANMLTRGGSCEFCKRRKLKCSAEQPACSACARRGAECVYSQRMQRSRVRVLEDRLAELERRLGPAGSAAAATAGAAAGQGAGMHTDTSALAQGGDVVASVGHSGGLSPWTSGDGGSILPQQAPGVLLIGDPQSDGPQLPHSSSDTPAQNFDFGHLMDPFGDVAAVANLEIAFGSVPPQQPIAPHGTEADNTSPSQTQSQARSRPPPGLGPTGFTVEKDEPDLMTLASAAAAGRAPPMMARLGGIGGSSASGTGLGGGGGRNVVPWQGMEAEVMMAEVSRVLQGGHGVGERIIRFIVLGYLTSPKCLPVSDPYPGITSLSSRLPPHGSSPTSPAPASPIHPALVLSILYLLAPSLPPSTFPTPSTPAGIARAALLHARTYTAAAYAEPDDRLLDVIAAQAIRAFAMYDQGRYLDGWAEGSGAAAMAWAAGLGKLGGVGAKFVSNVEQKGAGWSEAMERDRRNREYRFKGCVVPPPRDVSDYAQRVKLFWQIYLLDRTASVGWNFPSSFNDEEITTPWPLESYNEVDSLRSSQTIRDFLQMTTPPKEGDSTLCAMVKCLTLLYHATRLFDLPNTSAETTTRLIRVAKLYASVMPAVQFHGSGEWGVQEGPVNQNWVLMHTAMSFLYAKEEVDAPPGLAAEPLARCIDSIQKAADCAKVAREIGDFAFDGYDIMTATAWYAAGRTAFKLSQRFARLPGEREQAREKQMREAGETMLDAMKVMGKRMRYAAANAQILENISLGSEEKTGEWVRPDYTE